MRVSIFLVLVVVSAVVVSATGKGLQIGVKKRPETCEIRSKKGDKLSMHYNVSEYPCTVSVLSANKPKLRMPGYCMRPLINDP